MTSNSMERKNHDKFQYQRVRGM